MDKNYYKYVSDCKEYGEQPISYIEYVKVNQELKENGGY